MREHMSRIKIIMPIQDSNQKKVMPQRILFRDYMLDIEDKNVSS